MNLKEHIREVADWPKEKISFKDITPLLSNPQCFQFIVNEIAEKAKETPFEKIMGIDARGFLFAAALAYKTQKPLVLARKKGKLPPPTVTESYELEYGSSTLEASQDSLQKGDKVFLIDDLIATGGSAQAAKKLLEKVGAELVGASFVIDLRKDIGVSFDMGCPVFSLIEY